MNVSVFEDFPITISREPPLNHIDNALGAETRIQKQGTRKGISARIAPMAKDSELFFPRSNSVPSSLFDYRVGLFKPLPGLWIGLKNSPQAPYRLHLVTICS